MQTQLSAVNAENKSMENATQSEVEKRQMNQDSMDLSPPQDKEAFTDLQLETSLNGESPCMNSKKRPTGDENQASRKSARHHERHNYKRIHLKGLLTNICALIRDLAIVPVEPVSYSDAINAHDSKSWNDAMREQLSTLISNKTWTLIPKSQNISPITGKWVYKIKQLATGEIERYKARWVAKGYLQRYGIDFEESYAPVAKSGTVRIVLALAAIYDLQIDQIDFVSAFLNSVLLEGENIYIWPPEGYQELTGIDVEGKVCKLNKGLYGLKQSARLWYKTALKVLTELGFTRSEADHCLFIKGNLWVLVYVDDALIMGPRQEIDAFKKALAQVFAVRDLGNAKYYLGTQIQRNHNEFTLKINQELYVEKVLEKAKMQDSYQNSIPMDIGMRNVMRKNAGQAESSEISQYRSGIGSIMYTMTQTRPDLAYAIGKLAKYTANPSHLHLKALAYMQRYLRGSSGSGIVYSKHLDQEDPRRPKGLDQVYGYTDSDFAGDLDTRKSTSGYVFLLANAAVTWKARQQTNVAKSSTEAEYVALSEAGSEAIWLRLLLKELGHPQESTCIYIDNNASNDWAHDAEKHQRTKHIDIHHHYIRELVDNKQIVVLRVDSKENTADILTKPLGSVLFNKHLKGLGLI